MLLGASELRWRSGRTISRAQVGNPMTELHVGNETMNARLPYYFVACLAFVFVSSGATEFNWPGRGLISFDVPPNWTMQGKPATDASFYFRATTKSRNQAVMQVTLVDMPADKPVKPAKLTEMLNAAATLMLPDSVEKAVVPRGMLLAQGTGYWAEFTDAKLVGRPTIPGDYKLTRSAVIALDNNALVTATMQFDVSKAGEPAAMLAILSSMRFKRGATDGPASSTLQQEPIEFTVPASRIRLELGIEGLDRRLIHADVHSDHKAYFIGVRPSPNLNVSGWFEPASAYPGIRAVWARTVAGMKSEAVPDALNVTFGRMDQWEIVTYRIPMSGMMNAHLRAHLVRAGAKVTPSRAAASGALASRLK
jgi:hypothetical protein